MLSSINNPVNLFRTQLSLLNLVRVSLEPAVVITTLLLLILLFESSFDGRHLVAQAIFAFWLPKALASQGAGRAAIIIWAGDLGQKLAAQISASPLTGITLKGFFDDRASDRLPNGLGSAYSNGGGADVLHVNGLDFSRSFSLTGNAMLAWQGPFNPQDAGFSLQFIQAVPEPAEALMLLAGIAVIGTFSRLRRNHSAS